MAVSLVLLLAFLIGVVCGLRSLTGPAVVCWAAHLGWIDVSGTLVGFMGHVLALIIFSVLAVGELIADKLPHIPKRTSPMPLVTRIVLGALCGAALAVAGSDQLAVGAVLGAIGAVVGAFAGYYVRRTLTSGGKLPDLPVALVEDLIAIGGGLFLVSRF
jgi:uncharacterized membrane protein